MEKKRLLLPHGARKRPFTSSPLPSPQGRPSLHRGGTSNNGLRLTKQGCCILKGKRIVMSHYMYLLPEVVVMVVVDADSATISSAAFHSLEMFEHNVTSLFMCPDPK